MTAVFSSEDFPTRNINESSRPDDLDSTIQPVRKTLASKEIQDEPQVQGALSHFQTFAGNEITRRYSGEKIKIKSRVVKKSWIPMEYLKLGTIVKIKKSAVDVQWDESEDIGLHELRLVDEAPSEKLQKGSRALSESPQKKVEMPSKKGSLIHCSQQTKLNDNTTNVLLDNAPIEKIKPGSKVVKRSWIPQEELPIGTIVSFEKSRTEVQWDQFEKQFNVNELRCELDSRQSTISKTKVGSRVKHVSWTSNKEIVYPGKVVKVNDKKQTVRVKLDKHNENVTGYLRLVDNAQTEKMKIGSRVVRRSTKIQEEIIPFGTISTINQSRKEVCVHWDGPEEDVNPFELRLYDNAPAGVKHIHVTCDECYMYPLRGIRWKCLHCDNYDLCTICYMDNQHNVSHVFSRIQSEDSKGKEMPPRFDVLSRGYAYACGLLEGAAVCRKKEKNKDEHDKGTVLGWMYDKTLVQWLESYNSKPYERFNDILGLKCMDGARYQIYPDHLPILGEDTLGHLDVNFIHNRKLEKIQVNIRYLIEKEENRSYKPLLYLIFANIKNKDSTLMDEIFQYSKKTKLPCHVIGQKVLFLNGSSNTACIHQRTSTQTIEELVNKGFRILERGDTDITECEIKYFIRMAGYVLDEKVLPVIISVRNGGLKQDVLNSACSLLLPIIRFKKNSPDVRVFTLKEVSSEPNKVTEHITNLKTPWTIKSADPIEIKNANRKDEISAINDVESNLDFAALICHLVIGVSIADKLNGTYTLYANVLSMYLLKVQKWRIPEDAIKMVFDHRSIEYIYEKDLTTAFARGLRTDLEALSRLNDLPTDLKEKDIERAVSNCDVVGLIFLALLRKQLHSGAIQLVDTGFVRIRHILVGCKILHDASNDKKNEQLHRETSQRMKLYFTERATLITGFIYETTTNNDLDDKETGETVNHAGRLLVNHEYLEDAIRTQNKAFLENKTVTDILNKMWYGKEKSEWRQVGLFILFALLHLLVMPLLMVNINAPPLDSFYKKYNLPFMKAFIQMLGYLALLVAYAYMLLFNLSEEISYTDILIIGWMLSFCIHEIKQAIVSALRHKFKRYMCNPWNHLDWALMSAYASGMGLKFGDSTKHQDASKLLLVVTFILLSIRILNMCSISEFLGPKLVIIRKMFKDTFVFLVILTVIMMSYNVSFHSLLYPNSELSWSEIEKIMQNGYLMLFGELNLEGDTLTDCTFNKTIYTSGALRRCPTTLGLYISPYLKALYGLIAVVLLLNLLIAIYSDTYQKVNAECKFHWAQLQTDSLEEYSVQTIFPIHLQLLVLPACLVHFIIWCAKCGCIRHKRRTSPDVQDVSNKRKLNENPMFIRVFLYNANFDLRLKSTEHAERSGAIKSKGKIEITEENQITKLQNQMNVVNRKFENYLQRNEEKLQNQMNVVNRIFENYVQRNEEWMKTINNNVMKIYIEDVIKSKRKIQKKKRQTEST